MLTHDAHTQLNANEIQQECNVLFNCNHIKLKYTMVTIEKDILHVAQNPEHHSHTHTDPYSIFQVGQKGIDEIFVLCMRNGALAVCSVHLHWRLEGVVELLDSNRWVQQLRAHAILCTFYRHNSP